MSTRSIYTHMSLSVFGPRCASFKALGPQPTSNFDPVLIKYGYDDSQHSMCSIGHKMEQFFVRFIKLVVGIFSASLSGFKQIARSLLILGRRPGLDNNPREELFVKTIFYCRKLQNYLKLF